MKAGHRHNVTQARYPESQQLTVGHAAGVTQQKGRGKSAGILWENLGDSGLNQML